MKIIRVFSIFLTAVLSGCGGGELGNFLDTVFRISSEVAKHYQADSYFESEDDYSPPDANIRSFPLLSVKSGIRKSNLAKIGTQEVRRYYVRGTMTTPTFTNGEVLMNAEYTTSYEGFTTFGMASAISVEQLLRLTNITINNENKSDEETRGRSYFDTELGVRVGAINNGTYEVISSTSKDYPPSVRQGDTGTTFVYERYTDSTKQVAIGFSIETFNIISINLSPEGDLLATVITEVKNYNEDGELEYIGQSKDELFWATNKVAGTRNISQRLIDTSGDVTSDLTLDRIQ